MLDIATTKVYILEHKGTLYSESQINKVVKKIEKYRTTPVCDDETKAQYFLSVIEGIIAGNHCTWCRMPVVLDIQHSTLV